MAEGRTMRLNKVLRELNISLDRAVEHLSKNGHEIEARPTTKISEEVYQVLLDGFQTDRTKKAASKEVGEEKRKEKEAIRLELEAKLEKKRLEEEAKREVLKAKAEKLEIKTVGKIDISTPVVAKKAKEVEEAPKEKVVTEEKKLVDEKETKEKVVEKEQVVVKEKPVTIKKPVKKTTPSVKAPIEKEATKKVVAKKAVSKEVEEDPEVRAEKAEKLTTQYKKLDGPKLTGTVIDLKQFEKPKKKKPVVKAGEKKTTTNDAKKKRKRIVKPANHRGNTARPSAGKGNGKGGFNKGRNARPVVKKEEPTEAEVQKQVRETLERLQGKSSKGKGAKYRRDKRDQHRHQTEIDQEIANEESKVLKATEFVTVSEVATMMNVPVIDIISACMSLGMMVTMNQRLDAETLSIVAEEFNYKVEFVGAEVEEAVIEIIDKEEDLEERAPIITVMGHVDHGKTSLLDYIRKANVIEGESGGITQHIGAYSVEVSDGHKIAFLDTPGHEAFTAMRARGAQVTDLVIIVAAADDDIMPQTKEAISHAQAAGVPIIFAINKIDKPNANPDNVKTQLAAMNLLVEDWGGKIQSQDISAKTGEGIEELLEKVLLEAEVLELKANPNRIANGAVVEALLDKGRGYVSTILVQTGTLKIGDYILAGKHSGKVRAMFDDTGHSLTEAGPSMPVSILG